MGTLGAIRFVVNSMRSFPGRKSVILFTENIRLIFRGTTDEMVAHAVQQLSDAASRASVVIHAIDPRGMPDYNLTAADNTAGMSRRRVSRVPAQREQEVIRTEEGMFALAEETGGLFLHDTNDLTGALRKAAEDSDGYYLIGYHPDADTFEDAHGQPKFHKDRGESERRRPARALARRLLRRAGGGNQPLEHTRAAEIVHALQSPFAAGSIHPRLTAVFEICRRRARLSTPALLQPKELKWSSEPDGNHKASIDVAAAAFDENGLALAPIDTTFNLQLTAQKFDAAMKKGMVYGIHVPVNRPGPYVVRAAVRDAATEGQRFGPAVCRGCRMSKADTWRYRESCFRRRRARRTRSCPGSRRPARMLQAARRGGSSAAARLVVYGYEIINAKPGAGQHPELEVQTRLFRDGEQVMAGKQDRARSAGGRVRRAAPDWPADDCRWAAT